MISSRDEWLPRVFFLNKTLDRYQIMHSFICSENKYWVSTWARPHLGAGNTDFKHLCYQEVYMLLKGSIKYTKRKNEPMPRR